MRVPRDSRHSATPAPNYVNPVTRNHALPNLTGALATLCVVAVGLRIYVRIRTRFYGWDDTCLIVALLFAIALGVDTSLASLHGGWELHTWDKTPALIVLGKKYLYSARILAQFCFLFTRASLVLFYDRLVVDTGQKIWQTVVRLCFVVTIALFLLDLSLSIFTCRRIHAYWNPNVHDAHCLPGGPLDFYVNVVNTVADAALTLLPIPIVMNIKLPLRQRLAVLALLSLGLVVTATASVKTYFIYVALYRKIDTSWNLYVVWIAATVENDLAILCACAPAIKTLLSRSSTRRAKFNRARGISIPQNEDGILGSKQMASIAMPTITELTSCHLGVLPDYESPLEERVWMDDDDLRRVKTGELGHGAVETLSTATGSEESTRRDTAHDLDLRTIVERPKDILF